MPTNIEKDVSTEHARRWNTFANGKKPWSRFEKKSGEKLAVATSTWERWIELTRKEDTKINEANRRYTQWELLNEHLKAVGDTFVDIELLFFAMFLP